MRPDSLLANLSESGWSCHALVRLINNTMGTSGFHKNTKIISSRMIDWPKSRLSLFWWIRRHNYVTEEGIVRTEYLWRHPPVFEDVHGRTVPTHIPAGLPDEWKQAVKQFKQKGAAAERWVQPQGADGKTRHVKKVDGVDRGNSAYKSASPSEVTSGGRMSEHVIPGQVNSTDKQQHAALAMRKKTRVAGTAQKCSEYPNLARRNSL